jgi:cell division transport system permease protein
MPRDWDDRTDPPAPDPGRRLPRAREPRPADTGEKSVLLRRHRVTPPPTAPAQPQGEYDLDAGSGAFAAEDVRSIEAAAADWPPEPPPIDFQDLDFIRDELDHEMPLIEDEPEPVSNAPIIAAPTRQVPAASASTTRGTIPQPTGRRRRGARSMPREPGLPDTVTPIVPQQSVAGRALMLVVGIMCFLACLAVGALVLVEEAAHDWQLDVSREVTVQVKPVDGKPIEPMLQAAMDLARNTEGVRNVRLMSERDSAGLLEPWLGTGFDYSKLPIPRLIVIELTDPATANLKGLSGQLAAMLPNASLDDHSIWAKRLRTIAGTMVAASVVVLMLVLTAMVLSVIFATRAAMAGNRDVVQVLHFVGAEDSFVAGEFQHHFLMLGFKGGVGGGLGAMLAFLLAGWMTSDAGGASEARALFGGFSVGLHGYLGAAGIVFLVAGLTALTSRLTVRSYLNQLD